MVLPGWSPDSKRLVIGGKEKAAKGEVGGLWIVDVAGGSSKQILKDLPGAPMWVDWSPKGDLIAVAIAPEGGPKKKERGTCGVWLLKADGSGLKRIDRPKSDQDVACHPVFSPDGMRLTYRRMRGGPRLQTVIYDIAKGTEKVVSLEVTSPKPKGPPEKKAPPPGSPSKPAGSEEKK